MSHSNDNKSPVDLSASGSALSSPGAVVVLGMHRSGTSMVAGLLGILGGQLPKKPSEPAADNLTGFWEPHKIVLTHEELFDQAGFQNDTPMIECIGGRNIVDILNTIDSADRWVQALSGCVHDEFGSTPQSPIVLKDPRMCRLMPLWDLVFEQLRVRPAFVLPIRHPLEIAASLRARNGFDEGRSMWLWLDHVLRAEHDTRGFTRVFVHYSELLDNWRIEARRIQDTIGVDLAIEDRADEADRFVSSEQRHHRVGDAAEIGMPVLVADTYKALSMLADQRASSQDSEFDSLRKRFEDLRYLSGRWIDHAEGRARASEIRATASESGYAKAKEESRGAAARMKEMSAANEAVTAEQRRSIQHAKEQVLDLQTKVVSQAKRLGRFGRLIRRDHAEIDSLRLENEQGRRGFDELASRTQNELSELQRANSALRERLLEQSRSLKNAESQRESLMNSTAVLDQEQARLLAYIDSLHNSGSWRLTAPLRVLSSSFKRGIRACMRYISRRIERIGKLVKHNLPMSDSTQWALECVFFRLTGPMLRKTIGYSNHQQRVKFKNAQARSTVQELQGAAGMGGGYEADQDHVPEAILVFGVIDWFFRYQRPQHLAEQLARRGHRVLYLSPQFVNSSGVGFEHDNIGLEGGQEARVHQIRFHVKGAPPIYSCDLSHGQKEQIISGVRKMLLQFGIGRAITLVQHPAWFEFAGRIPNSRMIYDCMDHHDGFGDSSDALASRESDLIDFADLTIVTSNWLKDFAEPKSQAVRLIRNACDYEHFAAEERNESQTTKSTSAGRVIGYYGAVAEWFDVELVRKVAIKFANSTVLIIGDDSCRAGEQLADLPNVRMTGEVPYCDLPAMVHSMDVCMIPFVINDLTLATNPVKVYEMLAAGKPVVSTDLPELRVGELDGLVYRARTHHEFLDLITMAMSSGDDRESRKKRQEFAGQNRWQDRSAALESELVSLREPGGSGPLVSIVVITWNNLDLTRDAIQSILEDDSYPNIELIIVDNASSDGTDSYLRELESNEENVRVIFNTENTGFACANNAGLRESNGEYLILLNNDTVVTRGWIRTLVNHLKMNPDVGLLGPITNNIGNEARVQTVYQSLAQMPDEAFGITRSRAGELFNMPVAAFFCCIFSRKVYEEVGPLDENFGLGYFEDDDYCQRVRAGGYRICCASDVFVHHHLSAGFKLIDSSKRDALFAENLKYYESKWGTWSPHRYRDSSESGTCEGLKGKNAQSTGAER